MVINGHVFVVQDVSGESWDIVEQVPGASSLPVCTVWDGGPEAEEIANEIRDALNERASLLAEAQRLRQAAPGRKGPGDPGPVVGGTGGRTTGQHSDLGTDGWDE